MPTPIITQARIWEDGGASLMARVKGQGGNITQSVVTSIAYSTRLLTDVATELSSGALTVSSVVFDALQPNADWSKDDLGYNFRWDAPSTLFATGGATYAVEIKVTPSSGSDDDYFLVYHLTTETIHMS